MGHPSARLSGVDKILGPSFLATLAPIDQPLALEALAAWSEFRTRKKVAINEAVGRSFRFEVEQNASFEMVAMNIAALHLPGNATLAAGRTECGIVLDGGAERYAARADHIDLAAVCRRCAGRHLELAQALGLVQG